MTTKRVLGFDFGLARIGVASGQTITHTATPVTTLSAKEGVPEWRQIKALIAEWHPQALIVGIPKNMDDSEAPITKAARKFAAALAVEVPLTVHCIDERLTTKEARAQLKEQGQTRKAGFAKVDAFAACLIVETWMNQNQQGSVA